MADSQGLAGTSGTVTIPGSDTNAALLDLGPSFTTPQGGQVMSSSPYTESPTSFHTADQHDNDYQQDINSEILESPPSTPPTSRFYSDGRPRPVHDGDNESKDSFEDGYTTAAQIPRNQFVDPDQPKLLPAEEEDSIQPHMEKRPLRDEYSHSPTTGQQAPSQHHPHEGKGRQSRGHGQQGASNEQTPLLSGREREEEDERTGCCTIL